MVLSLNGKRNTKKINLNMLAVDPSYRGKGVVALLYSALAGSFLGIIISVWHWLQWKKITVKPWLSITSLVPAGIKNTATTDWQYK
jgi:GNAT superfamily N-acetyltransferase